MGMALHHFRDRMRDAEERDYEDQADDDHVRGHVAPPQSANALWRCTSLSNAPSLHLPHSTELRFADVSERYSGGTHIEIFVHTGGKNVPRCEY